MNDPVEKALDRSGRVKEERQSDRHRDGESESCRCKETSKMTPGQLLKLMISDLKLWRRTKRG